MSNIRGLPSVDGHYLKAILKWALEACPKPTEDDDSLSHLIFTRDLQVVACDGERYHSGCLPTVDGLAFASSYAVTRDSAADFLVLVSAACRIVGKGTPLHVYLDTQPDGDPGLTATIECQGELWPWTFQRCQLIGPLPDRWVPPVSEDAPVVSNPSNLRSMDISKATALDDAITHWRQAKPDGPVRLDFWGFVKSVDGQMRVATAVILPAGTRARFMSQEQAELFVKEKPGQDPGRSVLSLVIDSPGGVERPGDPGEAAEAAFGKAREFVPPLGEQQENAERASRRRGSGVTSVTFGMQGGPQTTITAEDVPRIRKGIAAARAAGKQAKAAARGGKPKGGGRSKGRR